MKDTQPVSVSRDIVKNFRLARVMRDAGVHPINSIDFHPYEPILIAADNGDSLNIYDVDAGKHQTKMRSEKYGIRHATYTKSTAHILHSSRPASGGDILRYWNIGTNTYVRYFNGHTDSVTSLCVAPDSDGFMSAAVDRTVRVWDLRKRGAVAVMVEAPGVPYAAYDHQGLIAGVAAGDKLRLYDLRNWGNGPFGAIQMNGGGRVSCLRFSNDGQKILTVRGENIFVYNAHETKPESQQLHVVSNGCRAGGGSPEACFDPSSQYILSGCQDGYVRVWSAPDSGKSEDVAKLANPHSTVPLVLKWSPNVMLLASGVTELSFWIPDKEIM